VPYGTPGQGATKPSKGLSKAMIILYWCTSAASLLVAFALFGRKGVWDDFVNGSASLTEIDDADSFAGLALVLQFALLLASAIVTCLWAKRIADNAKARGVTNVSPGMAAGGWFIPIGNWFLGFDQLRKSVTGVGGKSAGLNVWQGLFVGQALALFLVNRFGDFSVFDPDGVSDQLRNQGLVGALGAIIYIAATIFASKTAKEIDAAVTGG